MGLVTQALSQPVVHETKQRLLEAGVALLLERGYGGTSVQDLLDQTGIPKGSFYHHFESKEDMALQAVELYTSQGQTLLDMCLAPDGRPAVERIRSFFRELGSLYESQGYLGCLLGALGQELSGVNPRFRSRIEECLGSLSTGLAEGLKEAQDEGDLPPDANPRELADVLINSWEGAALRSRLLRNPAPLNAAIDFCFRSLAAA